MSNIFFDESDDIIDIRIDKVFKAVFTRDTPASLGALSGLISAFISRKITVKMITANEPPVGFLGERNIRFDISCIAESGELDFPRFFGQQIRPHCYLLMLMV